ncbi:MAG: hypothetical protein HQL22_08460 [Candidatus Omnitrophica bacterium]|nr:hypothetical protein [Candidatus Omnitrophota bacterium]
MKRQGDVLIVMIGAIPKGATKRKSRVLSEGEVTGHAHRLDGGKVYEKEDVLYFRAESVVHLNHEEHATLTLEPGAYRVIQQREYEPEGWRNVGD